MHRRALRTVVICSALGTLIWLALITVVIVLAHLHGTD